MALLSVISEHASLPQLGKPKDAQKTMGKKLQSIREPWHFVPLATQFTTLASLVKFVEHAVFQGNQFRHAISYTGLRRGISSISNAVPPSEDRRMRAWCLASFNAAP